ncbi:Hypothetical protein TPAR_09507 [Tolypocladium paradoxum]|uniref:Uncharacterized protein n=1 Tax=Tolypocladium paradoxum TaxID=94208 RepID=A0A2S4LAV9_9HYPO|nr:Hypothetical protein TPAR_09507 [Tolypocladium paradoxum]
MCNADTTPVANRWHETAGVFGPNFKTRHTCRNFDVLLEWGLARTTSVRQTQGRGFEVAKDDNNVMQGARLQSWIEKMRKAMGHGTRE